MEKDYTSTIEWLTKELTQAQEELKNIQAIEKEHQRINGELREANKLLNEQHISLYNNYCEELKRKNKAIEKLQLLLDIGFDYDGYRQASSLMTLIDELVGYARESRNILKGGSDE